MQFRKICPISVSFVMMINWIIAYCYAGAVKRFLLVERFCNIIHIKTYQTMNPAAFAMIGNHWKFVSRWKFIVSKSISRKSQLGLHVI